MKGVDRFHRRHIVILISRNRRSNCTTAIKGCCKLTPRCPFAIISSSVRFTYPPAFLRPRTRLWPGQIPSLTILARVIAWQWLRMAALYSDWGILAACRFAGDGRESYPVPDFCRDRSVSHLLIYPKRG